ncbi:MAG: divalent metal cation transporter [Cyclobacteriaceae bacterium]|nr:divalent metal cation transporter [Cyclobacteriaceae bacterium]
MIRRLSKYMGPGPAVTAAFIGPGTVTVCSIAGNEFGYALLWALALSVISTLMLQEMALRVAIGKGMGLARCIPDSIQSPFWRIFSIGVVIMAIGVGNAAYESGNIAGAALGAMELIPSPMLHTYHININHISLLTGLAALILLMSGSIKVIMGFLTAMVVTMSVAFVLSAAMLKPDIILIIKGFAPKLQAEQTFTALALVGTTVVPYNLFLHSELVQRRWKKPGDLKYARTDIIISVLLGGWVSASIIVAGAANESGSIESAIDLAKGLEPIMGHLAIYFLAFGLMAAGFTSAITAPLAGAMVVAGAMGWSTKMESAGVRWTAIAILATGIIFASLGLKPVRLIFMAQLINGILLPIITAYLIWLASGKSMPQNFRSKGISLFIYLVLWLITLSMGVFSIVKLLKGL